MMFRYTLALAGLAALLCACGPQSDASTPGEASPAITAESTNESASQPGAVQPVPTRTMATTPGEPIDTTDPVGPLPPPTSRPMASPPAMQGSAPVGGGSLGTGDAASLDPFQNQ